MLSVQYQEQALCLLKVFYRAGGFRISFLLYREASISLYVLIKGKVFGILDGLT